MQFKFCPYCGNQLEVVNKGHKKRLYCNPCHWTCYQNPTVGVAVILLQKNELLLVKRNGSYNPHSGTFFKESMNIKGSQALAKMCSRREKRYYKPYFY